MTKPRTAGPRGFCPRASGASLLPPGGPSSGRCPAERVWGCRQRVLATLSPRLHPTGADPRSGGSRLCQFRWGRSCPPLVEAQPAGRVPLSSGSYDGAPELGWASLGSRPGLWDLSPGCQLSGGRMAGRGAAAGRSSQMHARDRAHGITTRVISPYAGEVTGWSHLTAWACRQPSCPEGQRGAGTLLPAT